MKNNKYTAEEIKLEATLIDAANEEGTIQADAMLRIAPHHRPELHTTMSVSRAFEALTGKSYDIDYFCDSIQKYLAEIGRRGGKAATAAKSEAARQNGKKGGRPKKPKPIRAV